MTFIRKVHRYFHNIMVSVFIGSLFIVGPFIANASVSAQPMMDHATQMSLVCLSSCTNSRGAIAPQGLILLQEKKNTPAPPPDEPYYVQFRSLSFSKPLPPQDIITSSSFKPPDFNMLHSLFKF